jgi:hypothetical protein
MSIDAEERMYQRKLQDDHVKQQLAEGTLAIAVWRETDHVTHRRGNLKLVGLFSDPDVAQLARRDKALIGPNHSGHDDTYARLVPVFPDYRTYLLSLPESDPER